MSFINFFPNRFNNSKSNMKTFNPNEKYPVIHASICTGEKVAGFHDIRTGRFEDVMLVRGEGDLQKFRDMYGIEGEIRTEY